jgi:hypothetical protein
VIRTYFNFLILLLLYFLIGSSYAGLYDDWPDEAICLWLEQRPDHKGYLEENEKRGLNCFEREDFSPRDFVHVPLNLTMY